MGHQSGSNPLWSHLCVSIFVCILQALNVFVCRPQSECLQWQTGLSGQITTFNFPDTDGPHLPNQK